MSGRLNLRELRAARQVLADGGAVLTLEDLEALRILVAGVNAYLDLFSVCENCGGHAVTASVANALETDDKWGTCPACDGMGWTLNQERLEAAVASLWKGDPYATVNEDDVADIKAAILAYLAPTKEET